MADSIALKYGGRLTDKVDKWFKTPGCHEFLVIQGRCHDQGGVIDPVESVCPSIASGQVWEGALLTKDMLPRCFSSGGQLSIGSHVTRNWRSNTG